MMLRRKGFILTLVLAAILFGVIQFQIGRLELQHESAIRWMVAKAHSLLISYKANHPEYPKNLKELPWGDFQDGANIKMLDSIRYETDGERYLLEIKN